MAVNMFNKYLTLIVFTSCFGECLYMPTSTQDILLILFIIIIKRRRMIITLIEREKLISVVDREDIIISYNTFIIHVNIQIILISRNKQYFI